MEISQQLIDAIGKSSKVAIFIHTRPDGDCIGAGFALRMALIQLNKSADVYCDGEIGTVYSYIRGVDTLNKCTCDNYDTAISVDLADLDKLAGIYTDKYKAMPLKINIDHHATNTNYGDINLVDGTRASACEIIYELLLVLGVNITADMATALYTGIATDTGCFVHSSVQAVTHIITAELMQRGVDVGYINERVFKSTTINQLNLYKCALNNMNIYFGGKVCITYLTKSNFIDTHCKLGVDTAGLVNHFVDIDGVNIGILVSEDKPGICAVSFRSKGNVDVSKLGAYFGGGGHRNAAGCNVFGVARTAVKKIIKAIEEVYAGIY